MGMGPNSRICCCWFGGFLRIKTRRLPIPVNRFHPDDVVPKSVFLAFRIKPKQLHVRIVTSESGSVWPQHSTVRCCGYIFQGVHSVPDLYRNDPQRPQLPRCRGTLKSASIVRAVCVGRRWRRLFLGRDRENCGVQRELILCRRFPEQETACEKQGDEDFHIRNGSRKHYGYNYRKTLHVGAEAMLPRKGRGTVPWSEEAKVGYSLISSKSETRYPVSSCTSTRFHLQER
jgi:hypothetical protein